MNSRFAILFSLFLLPCLSQAKVNIEAFGLLIALPESCTYVLLNNDKGVFSCPSSLSVQQIVSFKRAKEFNIAMEQFIRDKEKIEKEAAGKSEDVVIADIEVKIFGSNKHFLRIYSVDGIESHVYSICDNESCIQVSSEDVTFVQSVISQIDKNSIYH
jgi:hypothetical protein